MNKLATFSFVMMAAILPGIASAFIDPPELEPNPALEGETVSLFLRMGECDGLNDLPLITIDGHDIDVLLDGRRRFDPIFCNIPIGERLFPIGSFVAGEYTVTVRFRFTPLFEPTQIETLAVLPLTVQAAPPAWPVPTGGKSVFILLAFFILVIAMFALRKSPAAHGFSSEGK